MSLTMDRTRTRRIAVPGSVGSRLLPVDDATRREFVVGAGAFSALFLGACSSDPAGGSTSASPAATTAVVDTPLGDVTVPVAPQRVIALYANDVDVALVLDLPLAGASTANGAGAPEAFAAHQPADEMAGVKPLQTYPEANYEAIAALRPDLMIDSIPDDGTRYDRLRAIAPTINYHEVVFGAEGSTAGPDWQGALRFLAEPFGKSAVAEEYIGEYKARAAALGERLTGLGTVVVVTPYDGQLYVQLSQSLFLSQLLTGDLGLTPAPVMARLAKESEEDEIALSPEKFSEIDADVLLVLVYPDADGGTLGGSAQLTGVSSNPLWERLPAVRSGKVVLIASELNFPSPLAATAVLDALDEAL